jgi:hypothetical protein
MNAPFLNGWSSSVGARVPSAKMTTALPSAELLAGLLQRPHGRLPVGAVDGDVAGGLPRRPKMKTRSSSFLATKWKFFGELRGHGRHVEPRLVVPHQDLGRSGVDVLDPSTRTSHPLAARIHRDQDRPAQS